MAEKFMGLYFREYMVRSKYGAQVALKAQSKADALMTAAELLDADVSDLHLIEPTDW